MRKTILLGLIVGALPFVVAAVAQAKPSRTTGACCFWPSGNCIDLTEADCIAQGGTYIGGTTCVSYVCPHGEPSCANLPTVTMPAQSPYSDPHQHTCGRVNDFDSTCLGDYDGGEDIVYKLIVTEDTCVDITVTGNTPTNNWFGVD